MSKTVYQVVYLHEYVNNRKDFHGTDDEYHLYFMKNYQKEFVDHCSIRFEHPIDKKTVWLVVDYQSQHFQIPTYFKFIFFLQKSVYGMSQAPDMIVDWNILHDGVLAIEISIHSQVIEKNPIQLPEKYPSQLKYLTIFVCEQTLKIGKLPNTLSSLLLIMMDTENGFIEEGAIPESVETLYINTINQPITKNLLPKNLKNFKYLWSLPSLTPGSLPDSLEYFEYPDDEIEYLQGILPERLKYLKINGNFVDLIKYQHFLPQYLEYLHINLSDIEDFEEQFVFTRGILPLHLKTLVIESNVPDQITYRFEPGSLPEGLIRLEVDISHDQKFEEGVLPSTLEILLMGYLYDCIPDIHLFPPSLKYISNKAHEYEIELQHDNLPFMKCMYQCIQELNRKTLSDLKAIYNLKQLMMTQKMKLESTEPPKKKRVHISKNNIIDTILSNPIVNHKIWNYLKPERELIYHDLQGYRPFTMDIQFDYTFHPSWKEPKFFIEEDEEEDPSEYDAPPSSF